MNPTNPCKDLGLSLLYLSMHPFSSVMPIGTGALGSFPPKLFQNQTSDQQPQLFAPLPNSHDFWCWAMGLHPPMWLSPTLPLFPNLGQSAPVQPQSHVPLACARLCALHGRCLCAWPVRVAWALCLGAPYARCMSTVPGRCLCTLHGHCAWALPVGSQPDHGIAPMITNRMCAG